MSSGGLELDLAIIPTYNANMLAITDVSTYPVGYQITNPFLEVTPPGLGRQVLVFEPRQINIYNSTSLRLTPEGVYPAPLPDGVWKLRYSVMPNYERFIEKAVMRLDQIMEQLDNAFLTVDLSGCDGELKDKRKQQLDRIEFYLQAAMAAANKCNEKLAIDYYRKAKKMLDKLDC